MSSTIFGAPPFSDHRGATSGVSNLPPEPCTEGRPIIKDHAIAQMRRSVVLIRQNGACKQGKQLCAVSLLTHKSLHAWPILPQ